MNGFDRIVWNIGHLRRWTIGMAADLEAEQTLLGILLAANDVYATVRGIVPEQFADRVHGVVFDEIENAIIRGELADPATMGPLLEEVAGGELFDDIPIRQYLRQLPALCPDEARGRLMSEALPILETTAKRMADRIAALWRVRLES